MVGLLNRQEYQANFDQGSDASPGKEHWDLYEFEFAIMNDDVSPCTSNPRLLSNLDITIEPKILSTTDPAVGREEAPYYKDKSCITLGSYSGSTRLRNKY